MSELPDKFWFKGSNGREFIEKMRSMAGAVRTPKEWRRFWELAEKDELDQCLKPFTKEFPKGFN